MSDMVVIVATTVVTCLVIALLGGLVLHLVRTRQLVWSIVVAALVPLLAVSASVVLNVQLMFLSSHDATAVSVALVCATLIGVLLSFVLGRRVALGVPAADERCCGSSARRCPALMEPMPVVGAPAGSAPGEIAGRGRGA